MVGSQGTGLKSRKFWVTVIGITAIVLVVFILARVNIGGEVISGTVTSIAGIVGAYVIGQSYADGQAVKK
ncbi:MAG: hypothetical protein SYNGOMJ08_00211 [Candidatus Syntrophoarchaeum sp. GoM_oil]|nr:MAG: hypothetical protein SYNGOMJ08_00211 [Candidatus Syntrophoarchaeum sp. GoM_oil]